MIVVAVVLNVLGIMNLILKLMFPSKSNNSDVVAACIDTFFLQ